MLVSSPVSSSATRSKPPQQTEERGERIEQDHRDRLGQSGSTAQITRGRAGTSDEQQAARQSKIAIVIKKNKSLGSEKAWRCCARGRVVRSESVIYGNKVLMGAMFPVSKPGAAGQERRSTSQAASWCS